MRLLDRDKRTFWYANYTGGSMVYDASGLPNGERTPLYDEPEKAEGTFSMPTGAATPRAFGTYIDYDYEIHMDGPSCPFDENAAIWINRSTDEDPDFRAVKIATLPSYVAVAVRELR